eukprot:scaffold34629_cov154-Amphora_coffeaeformis.AAC.3
MVAKDIGVRGLLRYLTRVYKGMKGTTTRRWCSQQRNNRHKQASKHLRLASAKMKKCCRVAVVKESRVDLENGLTLWYVFLLL